MALSPLDSLTQDHQSLDALARSPLALGAAALDSPSRPPNVGLQVAVAPAPPRVAPDTSRVSLFGMKLDRIGLADAAARVLGWAEDASYQGPCRYVVTPNVDHAVMYQSNARLRDAYGHASMVVADGAPLVAAARLVGKPLPGRVAGSDLTPLVLAEASAERAASPRPPLRVFLLGAGPGVAERAATRIADCYPGVEPVGVDSPPLGFEKSPFESERILHAVEAAAPDLLIVGFGAPKQELWVRDHYERLGARVALCVGATIDFLAGEKRRAPAWMRSTGLEWLHRLASEPRRLARRYARDAWLFPPLVWRELRGSFD